MAWPRLLGIVLGLIAVFIAGCAGDRPTPLRIAFVPQQDMEERYAGAYRALDEYLEAALGRPVEVIQLENATAALEGLRAHKLDVCNFSPWPFLIAERKADVEAFLVTQSPSGVPVSYESILVTRPETGLRTIDDVKTRSHELVFSFEEAVSTSGHLVPRAFFHEIGLVPERDFKRVLFAPDSTVSLLAVKAARLDLAAVSYNGLQRNIRMGRMRESDVVVIWRSPPILANITAVRRSLPASIKDPLRDALVRLHEVAPEKWAEVARQYSQPVVAYQVASDAMIAPIRALVRDVPGLELTL